MKKTHRVTLAILLVIAIIYLVILMSTLDKEGYNQFRVVNLGRYLYNELKRDDGTDWRKRCKRCAENPALNGDFCAHCHEYQEALREGYSQSQKRTLGRITARAHDIMRKTSSSSRKGFIFESDESINERFGGLKQEEMTGQFNKL